jgi:hypothetical protein
MEKRASRKPLDKDPPGIQSHTFMDGGGRYGRIKWQDQSFNNHNNDYNNKKLAPA